MLPDIELTLPRHCFSPRQVARAGEIWRLCQEVAVRDSARRGWPPQRYLDAGSAFVVTRMTVRHSDEIRYGEPLIARTWVRDFRRGILSRRDVRLFGPRGLVAAATQRWAHVDATLKPTRAPAELLADLEPGPPPQHAGEPPVAAPEIASPREGPEHLWRFTCWQTWMDPLDHVNHPVYADWCDEAICRVLAAAGLAPAALQPAGEQISWRAGAVAGEPIAVSARLVGVDAEGAAVIRLEMRGADDRPLANAIIARRLAGSPGALAAAMG